MSKSYNFDETVALMREVVAERGGDYVYKPHSTELGPTCYYIHPTTGEGDCGVGVLFLKVGIDAEFLQGWETSPASDVAIELYGMDIEFNQDARNFLDMFQYWQDMGHAWGDSLQRAIRDALAMQ
jgi:hypothetical protein